MTIEVIVDNQISREHWDEYVSTQPSATPYHLFAWGEAVERAYGFKCHRFAVTENRQYVGILPVVEMRTMTGKKHFCALPYCDVGAHISNSDAIALTLKDALFKAAKKLAITDIELRASEYELLTLDAVRPGEKVRMQLSLPDSEDALMAQFKSKLRSQIRKAEKNGLTYKTIQCNESNDGHVSDFYDIIAKNMRALGSPVHAKQWYQAICSKYGKNAYIALVYSEDVAVGAAIVLKAGNKASIPWASTLADYNRLAPNMLLYWAVLSEATKQEIAIFDFGRSTVSEGTYNFKKQWGCQPMRLDWQSFENEEQCVTAHVNKSKSRERIENVWRKLPLQMTNFLGPKIRKHISL
ncbi:FemAB family XrtA/PEP-CTERM system-associated protein [Agaribacter marinus]|uniref:BioF2-like acetyltransferase domain-containing protein n=1 Tax=Agaribacter marinus TaxID=1431249 RepID=A0AA37SWE4_9ALTE|nr:FemAB family XrtA/PEP-CTERM system-associated protein [Agaribacter marinus]GLR70926.1 hypothetical protein GCM10007852_18340 [Agaribacter marinus]